MNALQHVPTKSLTLTTPQAGATGEPIASRKKVPHADVDQDGAQPSSADRPDMETLGSAEATADVAVSTGSEAGAGAGSATATLNSSEDQSCKRDGQDGEDEDCNRAVAAWVTGGAALALLGGGAALASHGSDRPKANAAEPAPPVVIEPPVKQPLVVTFAAPPVSNHGTPALSGTAPAGSAVDLYEGSNKLGSTTADPEGKWSLTPTQPFGDGTHALTAKSKDAAGNEGSKDASVLIDTVAPSVSISSAAHTNDNTPEVTGTAPAGSQVDIYDGESKLGGTTSDEHGKWSFSPTQALADGNHTLVAKVKDDAGNEGAAHATVDVDTVAPTVTLSTPAFTNNNTPTVTGTAPAGGQVDVYEGTTKLGSGTADASGNWTFTPTTLADGSHTLTAKIKDAAGNEGSKDASVLVDTVAPDRPDVVTSNGLPVLNAQGSLLVHKLEDGATWEYRIDGGAWQVGQGGALASSALHDGNQMVDVRQTDRAGNVSEFDSVSVTLDATPPDTLLATAHARSGTAAVNNLINATGYVSIDNLEAGATWQFKIGNDDQWRNGAGAQISTRLLDEGHNAIQLQQTDSAGNVSASGAIDVVLDTVAPVAPTVQTNTGKSLVDANASIVLGDVEAGSKVTVSVNGTAKEFSDSFHQFQIGNPTLFPSGTFHEGGNAISVFQTDAAGNVSETRTLAITRDSISPQQISLTLQGGGDGQMNSSQDFVQIVNGEAGATLMYRLDGGAWQRQDAGVNKIEASAFVNPPNAVISNHDSYGDYVNRRLEAYQVDPVGNIGLIGELDLKSYLMSPPPAGV